MLEHIPPAVGQALGAVRAGTQESLIHHADLADCPTTITVGSPAFAEGGSLDRRFTADGAGRSPPLVWRGSPAAAGATVIVVEDLDSPTPIPLLHLLAWTEGGDGAMAEGVWGPDGGDERTGYNSFHKRGWLPPDPPPGHGPHRYLFEIFAVDALPDFTGRMVRKADVVAALKGHVLGMGSSVGTYARP